MVTIEGVERSDIFSVRVRFSSDRTPPVPFRVGVDGKLASSFVSQSGYGEFVAVTGADDVPAIEVLDHPKQIFSPAFSGRMTLQWDRVAGATQYVVAELVSAVWTTRATVPDDGRGAYQWRTRRLDDATAYQFRVTPMGSAGQTWPTKTWSFTVARTPDVPVATFTFNAGTGLVTIS